MKIQKISKFDLFECWIYMYIELLIPYLYCIRNSYECMESETHTARKLMNGSYEQLGGEETNRNKV